MPMSSIDAILVVSRYNEDVSWVSHVDFPVLLYDKSCEFLPNSLPNIGRETHTYLHYILSRYPFFPNYTVFLQGNPFKHMCLSVTPELMCEIIRTYMEKKVFFKGLANFSIKCDYLGRPHDLANNNGKWNGYLRDIPVGCVYGELFSGQVPQFFHCRAPAGLFIVHSSRILCRPVKFYEKAMEIVMRDPLDEMNTGHAFERLWYIIFNGDYRLNKFN